MRTEYQCCGDNARATVPFSLCNLLGNSIVSFPIISGPEDTGQYSISTVKISASFKSNKPVKAITNLR